MPYQTEEDKIRHEAELRRQDIIWEKYYEHLMLSDRGAIDTGLSALKTAVLINAGALVTLIAFVAQIWSAKGGKNLANSLFHASAYFTVGVMLAGISFTLAYFYQGAVTSAYRHMVNKFPVSSEPFPKNLVRNQYILFWPMVVSGVLSVMAFIVGSYVTLCIFGALK